MTLILISFKEEPSFKVFFFWFCQCVKTKTDSNETPFFMKLCPYFVGPPLYVNLQNTKKKSLVMPDLVVESN